MNDPRSAQADALIDEWRRQGGGQLTVFLGAAPGVGKTFAMLTRAHDLQRRGIDVVIGIVETHGRSETAALLDGLTVVPRKLSTHHGRQLEEFDLDAVLARKPALVVVDELAHHNVPGSRHQRRWQDVIELLDAGIDVHTAMNIQHLESLNDIVHRITGVRVSETVPDAVFDRLRDIVLVDLPARDLIERLQQGKVYLPDQAAHALQAFFSHDNLAALRELAMQTAATCVDNDLRDARTARGAAATPLRRRVLVAIDGHGQSEYLVRVGRRLAERRDAPWTVVSAQTGGAVDEARQIEIDRAFALARRLGGDSELLHGNSVVEALIEYAAASGSSAIVIGRTRERPIARMFNRALTQQLIQRGAHLELTIVSTPEVRAKARRDQRSASSPAIGRDVGLAVLAAVLATAIAAIAERWAGLQDLSAIFIVAVVMVAARTRMAAAMLVSALCFLAYNFFFIDPRWTLLIGARQGVVTVLLFLIAAIVAGRLAARLRMQVLALRAANAHTTTLQSLSQQLAGAADLDQVLAAASAALKRAFDADACVLLGDHADNDQARTTMAATDRAAADWAQKNRQPAGRHTDTLGASEWWFLPMAGTDVGVVGLRFPQALKRITAPQRRLAEAMSDDIAQAIVRTRLVGELADARVSTETERLRSALLSSVSHDLRSPLAAIIGAASSLDHYAAAMTADDRHSLLDTIRIEGERLDRYIQNLLDMTRLGHGGLTLNRDWIGVDELIGSAITRLHRYQPAVTFDVRVDADIGPLWVHPALIEQALFNVLENAAKFSPPALPIIVSARRVDDDALRLDISDHGPGIPEDERRRIFDMFYSVERGDRGRNGTGLGLSICRGMIGAHGGSVEALPGIDGRGTTIRITLPRIEPTNPGP